MSVPALQWLAEKLIFPGIRPSDIYLHPVARAAWVGMFATAMNLLPAGQLDGGHVVYALLGRRQVWVTNMFLVALVPMGRYWWVWWMWGAIILFFARKHPPVYDSTAIGESRIKLGIVALCVFILCFSLAPINE
jgi:membrane-associated protease RseP (regulator of RpoE activity)